MPCVKGFSMLQKRIHRDKKVVLKTTCCPLTLALLTLERECQVALGEVLLGNLQALTFAMLTTPF